ncbi:MAG: PD-(D/E)XK nuclease family protein [Candidatus Symbiothrix sp.]|jgi:hypothetical protein|nr:PD-(D/E)XK nuclease family protein [Candidatus Symbiothrix sp.]
MENCLSDVLLKYNEFSAEIKNSIVENSCIFLSEWEDILEKEQVAIIDNAKIVVDAWVVVYENHKQSAWDPIKLEEMTAWHKDFLKDEEQHKIDGHNFNVFDLLSRYFDLGIKETIHSKLIKFLLDSDETHGQGDLFLIKFLELLEIESPQKGIWHISAETEGRIDILLQRSEPQSVIIIENKAKWAGDQPNQLYRYWHSAIYSQTTQTDKEFYERKKDSFKIIYLPPTSAKQYEEQSITRPNDLDKELPLKVPIEIETKTFDDFIQKWLKNCIAALTPKNHRIREYMEQYKLLCKSL